MQLWLLSDVMTAVISLFLFCYWWKTIYRTLLSALSTATSHLFTPSPENSSATASVTPQTSHQSTQCSSTPLSISPHSTPSMGQEKTETDSELGVSETGFRVSQTSTNFMSQWSGIRNYVLHVQCPEPSGLFELHDLLNDHITDFPTGFNWSMYPMLYAGAESNKDCMRKIRAEQEVYEEEKNYAPLILGGGISWDVYKAAASGVCTEGVSTKEGTLYLKCSEPTRDPFIKQVAAVYQKILDHGHTEAKTPWETLLLLKQLANNSTWLENWKNTKGSHKRTDVCDGSIH